MSRTLARIGAALILAGILLPWYKFDLSGLTDAIRGIGVTDEAAKSAAEATAALPSKNISLWETSHAMFIGIGVFAVLALGQIEFASKGLAAKVFMVGGFAGAVLVGYRIVHPPLDILEVLKMKLKPMPGIWLALAGFSLIAWGGWQQVKRDLKRAGSEVMQNAGWTQAPGSAYAPQNHAQQQHAQQKLAPPQFVQQQAPAGQYPPGYAQPAAPQHQAPGDPFAPQRPPGS